MGKDELKVKGEIVKILDVEQGESKAGKSWKKVNFVLLQNKDSDYPKEACFTIFGEEKVDKFTQFNNVGDEVIVFFNLESREFNEKYYTNANAWMVRNSNEDAPKAEDPKTDKNTKEGAPPF